MPQDPKSVSSNHLLSLPFRPLHRFPKPLTHRHHLLPIFMRRRIALIASHTEQLLR